VDEANADQADADGDGIGDACEGEETGAPVPPDEGEETGQPAPVGPAPPATTAGGGRAPCGIYNGVALIALPFCMLAWMGARTRARQRSLRG
jgi:hypothetical protein